MNPPTPADIGSFYLEPLIKDLLAESHTRPISFQTAEALLLKCKNQVHCHVQLPTDSDVDMYGKPISTPILWQLGHWQLSTERWMKRKIQSDKERDERRVEEENIKVTKKAILRTVEITPDQAACLAHKWVNRKMWDKIKGVGVTKIYTDIKELP